MSETIRPSKYTPNDYDESDSKSEGLPTGRPYRNRGYSVDSESMVLCGSDNDNRSPRRRKTSYTSDEVSLEILSPKNKTKQKSNYESSIPKQNRSSRYDSRREYKEKSPPRARPKRYSERTSRRKCRSGVKKRGSRPASPARNGAPKDRYSFSEKSETKEDAPCITPRTSGYSVSEPSTYSMTQDPLISLKHEKHHPLLDCIELYNGWSAKQALAYTFCTFWDQGCTEILTQVENSAFLYFMDRCKSLCAAEDGLITATGEFIRKLKILSTLKSSDLTQKKKDELRETWKWLLANAILHAALETYHCSPMCRKPPNKSKQDTMQCTNRPFDCRMTPHAYYSVDMLDKIFTKPLERLIRDEFPHRRNIDTVTYSELVDKLKAKVISLSSFSGRSSNNNIYMESFFRSEDPIFAQFLALYLLDKELWTHLDSQKDTYIANLFCKLLRNTKPGHEHLYKRVRSMVEMSRWPEGFPIMNQFQVRACQRSDVSTARHRSVRDKKRKDVEEYDDKIAELVRTPEFQVHILTGTLRMLSKVDRERADVGKNFILRSIMHCIKEREVQKFIRETEISKAARQNLYNECKKEKHKKNRKEKRKKKHQRRHKGGKSQKSYKNTEADEETPTFSEPSYEQKYPPSDEQPRTRILQALKNNPYRQGWIVHQRVKQWSNDKDVPVWAKKLPSRERDLTIAQHNLSDLIYLLASPLLKDKYSTKYNFRDRKSNSIYGQYKQGRALIAKMRYNGTTYSGTIFLGIGYDKKKGKEVLYHAQFVDYVHREISLHDISENISKQLEKCSQASDRVEKPAEGRGWTRKGKFTVKDGNVIVMDTKRAGTREIEATFYIYPR